MKLFTGVVYTCLGIVSAIALSQALLAWTNPTELPGEGGGAISSLNGVVSINQLKITGGTPGTGKVLTSDTVGLATWVTPASGLPTGTTGQTLRHNGTAWIANSVLINDGTNIGVSGNINLSGATPTYKVTNLIAPTAAADAATKGYVDAASGGGGGLTTWGFSTIIPTTAGAGAPACPTGWTQVYAGFGWVPLFAPGGTTATGIGEQHCNSNIGNSSTTTTTDKALWLGGVYDNLTVYMGRHGMNQGALTCRVCVK